MGNIKEINNMNVFNVENAKVANQNSRPIQSANSLFRFVDRLEYLIYSLENLSLVPRYCTEDIEYLDIEIKKIAYPMLCFCDLNLHKMQEHINFYGGYGLAFSKKWGIAKGIQPVQYISSSSRLKKDFSNAFMDTFNYLSNNSEEGDSTQNFLALQMMYFKPITGSMERNYNGVIKNVSRYFTDESEWRYILEATGSDFPSALTEENISTKETWNEALQNEKNYHLKFSADDIKYIIIKSRDEFNIIVEAIHRSGLDKKYINKLISNILIWSELMEDL